MSLFHSPRIVTDGLVLCLDAGNIKSYPGSGTTWTDLSGRRNNGTLTNGPTYSSTNGGSIVFDGTNDYVTVGSSPYTGFGTGDFTLECWVYMQVSGSMVIYDGRYSSSATGFALSYDTVNGLKVFYSGGNRIVGGTISANAWNHVAVAKVSGSTRLYVNGSQVGSTYADTNNYTSGAQNAFIGAGYNLSAFWNGYMSTIKVYNGKGLTAQEIQQNFNALRGRFGI